MSITNEFSDDIKMEFFEEDNVCYAVIFVHDTCHSVGPAHNRDHLLQLIMEKMSDIKTIIGIKQVQRNGLESLRQCLFNLSVEHCN